MARIGAFEKIPSSSATSWGSGSTYGSGRNFLDYAKMGSNFGAGDIDSDSGGGFSGAFSKNFGKNFMDIYGSGMGGGGDNSKNYFAPTSLGGGSIQPIGSGGKHFLYQYTHPQATIMPSAPDQPGFLENVATAAIPAAIGAWCDERLKVDMAPLESTEVNDSLAEIAFFVKGLRECA